MKKAHEFEWRILKPSVIRVDSRYQRPLSEKQVARMIANFDPDLVNAPKVSLRDGGAFYVFDGQHTVNMWRKIYGDKPLLCKVYRGLTWLDEKDLFVRQFGDSKPLCSGDRLRAEYNAGDPDVKAMVAAANLAGLEVQFAKQGSTNGKINAVSALYKAYQKAGAQILTEVLRTIRLAWDGESQSLSAGFILGVTNFYLAFYGRFQQKELVKKLASHSPAWYMREAKDIGGRLETRYFRLFLKVYNAKRTTNRLEVYNDDLV